MSGHDHAHEEDHMICVKVGVFFILVITTLYFLAL